MLPAGLRARAFRMRSAPLAPLRRWCRAALQAASGAVGQAATRGSPWHHCSTLGNVSRIARAALPGHEMGEDPGTREWGPSGERAQRAPRAAFKDAHGSTSYFISCLALLEALTVRAKERASKL